MGVLAALLERGRSGRGQVIDAAMVDGVSALLQPVLSWRSAGLWTDDRESNLLDGGAPYYDTYICADGRFVAVGAIENRFYAALVDGLRADRTASRIEPTGPTGRSCGPSSSGPSGARTRDEWAELFSGTDACVTPVLTFAEAADHPQLQSRGSLHRRDGMLESAPAPRFSRSVPGPDASAAPATLASMLDDWPPRD